MQRMMKKFEVNVIAQTVGIASLYLASLAVLMYQIGSAAGYLA